MNNASRFFLGITMLFCAGCSGAKEGSASKNEQLNMAVKEDPNQINVAAIKEQNAPSLADRGAGTRGFLVTPLVGSLVSVGTNAVKKMIDNEEKKYHAEYYFGLNDLYFYDQLSNEGPFDPVGLQFGGFKLVRTFTNEAGSTDTAFIADIVLDTSNVYEILNNSIFRLKLKDFKLHYAKAKVAGNKDKILNMDFEITMLTSYVNESGNLFGNVVLGKFYLLLRNAPLDPAAPNYNTYYASLKNTPLTGQSFIVPRSFGYRKESGNFVRTYNQAAYSIQVKVNESSKSVFVNKLLLNNAKVLIDAGGEKLEESLNTIAPTKF